MSSKHKALLNSVILLWSDERDTLPYCERFDLVGFMKMEVVRKLFLKKFEWTNYCDDLVQSWKQSLAALPGGEDGWY